MTMDAPRMDSGLLKTSIVKAAGAHDAVKQQIAQHAAEHAAARVQAHAKLRADNIAAGKQ